MHVDCHGSEVPCAAGHTDLNIVSQNFKQDCHYLELHGVSFIDQLDCAISEANVFESVDMKVLDAVNINSENQPNTVDIGGAACLQKYKVILL